MEGVSLLRVYAAAVAAALGVIFVYVFYFGCTLVLFLWEGNFIARARVPFCVFQFCFVFSLFLDFWFSVC